MRLKYFAYYTICYSALLSLVQSYGPPIIPPAQHFT